MNRHLIFKGFKDMLTSFIDNDIELAKDTQESIVKRTAAATSFEHTTGRLKHLTVPEIEKIFKTRLIFRDFLSKQLLSFGVDELFLAPNVFSCLKHTYRIRDSGVFILIERWGYLSGTWAYRTCKMIHREDTLHAELIDKIIAFVIVDSEILDTNRR